MNRIATSQDFDGSTDHAILKRYPGAIIKWYDVQAFSEYKIATGSVTGYQTNDDWQEVEGKLTRIYYVLMGVNAISEIFANYKKAFEKEGFEILAKGLYFESSRKPEVGSYNWMGTAYSG